MFKLKSTFGRLGILGAALMAGPGASAPAQEAAPPSGQTAQAANLATVLKAQGQYQSLMAGAHDSYSATLLTLEANLNAYAKRNGLDQYSRIIIIDPLQADVGVALGLPKDMVTGTLLLQKGAPPYESFTATLSNMLFAAASLPTSTDSVSSTYTQEPHALFFFPEAGEKSPCVIVPAPENTIAKSDIIPGLSPEETADFLNGHEGWHCLDDLYYPRRFPAMAYRSFDPQRPETLLDNPAGLEIYSVEHKKEVLVDVAKLGENIRGGKDPKQIDFIIAWRRGQGDLMHNSVPALEKLKKTIAEIGLKNFRAFDDFQARRFYYDVVELYALDAPHMKIAIASKYATKKAQESSSPKTKRKSDIARNFASGGAHKTHNTVAAGFFGSIFSGPPHVDDARDTFLKDALAGWPALELLEKEAQASGQDVSPASMTDAYVKMQTGLEKLQQDDPGNADLYVAQASKLKDAYIKMSYIDFSALSNPSSRGLPMPRQ